jgi:hypothetical protein
MENLSGAKDGTGAFVPQLKLTVGSVREKATGAFRSVLGKYSPLRPVPVPVWPAATVEKAKVKTAMLAATRREFPARTARLATWFEKGVTEITVTKSPSDSVVTV